MASVAEHLRHRSLLVSRWASASPTFASHASHRKLTFLHAHELGQERSSRRLVLLATMAAVGGRHNLFAVG